MPLQEQDDLTVELEVVGDLVPSWRADLGLVTHLDEKRPAQIRVTSSAKVIAVVSAARLRLSGLFGSR